MKNLLSANAAFFDRDGHLNEESVAMYVDALRLDQLSRLPVAVASHVETCLSCKEEIFALHEVLHEQDFKEHGAHPFFEKPVARDWRPILLRVAAVLLLGASAVFVFNRLQPGTNGEKQIVAQEPLLPETPAAHDSSATASPEPEITASLAAHFEVAPDLESLIDVETRASGLEILAPKNNSAVQTPIVFKWQGEAGAPLHLKVLNNREEVLFETALEEASFVWREKLTPGLYYWKLETEEELLYVGKFLVQEKK